MGDTLIRPDQPTDPALGLMSTRARLWLLVVACLDVSLVVSSMIALNTALGGIAVDTSATQTQLTWVVDGYTLVLACLLLPAGAIGDRYGRRGVSEIAAQQGGWHLGRRGGQRCRLRLSGIWCVAALVGLAVKSSGRSPQPLSGCSS